MSATAERPRHFLSLEDWPREAVEAMLDRALELKALRARGERVASLAGRSVLLYFDKPSLRTFVTFEVGVTELGGYPVYLPPGQVQLGEREPIEDVARNLSRWVHAIVARTFGHEVLTTLAEAGSVPVINALSDWLHPCQAMADALTIREHGDLQRDRLVYIGDGNNVAHSLLNLAGCLGMKLTVCTPDTDRPDMALFERSRTRAAAQGGDIQLETDPIAAVKDAAFLYTDVWASMGQEAEAAARRRRFARYRIDEEVMAAAPAGARVLHCLPAHRGEEISEAVLESDASLVFDQAENRLHAQKAVLETLLR